MHKIIRFSQDDAFGPDALRAMSTALEEVCRMLKIDRDQGAREVMAVRIIELTRRVRPRTAARPTATGSRGDLWKERAALIEYDGGEPRLVAEAGLVIAPSAARGADHGGTTVPSRRLQSLRPS